jgi:hypothetical protein
MNEFVAGVSRHEFLAETSTASSLCRMGILVVVHFAHFVTKKNSEMLSRRRTPSVAVMVE